MSKAKLKYSSEDLKEFVHQSNLIESVDSEQADEDGVAAVVLALELLADGEVTKDKILQIHERLMRNIDPEIAGVFRYYNVGMRLSPTKFKNFPDYQRASELLSLLCDSGIDTADEDEIKKWHIEFEGIHPFGDGNGRTGRAIMCAQRILAGLPIEIIWNDEKHDYYSWFK